MQFPFLVPQFDVIMAVPGAGPWLTLTFRDVTTAFGAGAVPVAKQVQHS